MEKGSELGVNTAATTTMMITAQRHHLRSWAGVMTCANFERDQHDRELEGQPEDRHHQQNEPEVRDGVIDRLEVGPADRVQPAQSVRQDDVGGGRTGEEECERAQHERDRVATLGSP